MMRKAAHFDRFQDAFVTAWQNIGKFDVNEDRAVFVELIGKLEKRNR